MLANSTFSDTGFPQIMGIFETAHAIAGKIRRAGFYLYIGIVFGLLGWTFWEMHRLNKQLEKKREREDQDRENEQRKRLHR